MTTITRHDTDERFNIAVTASQTDVTNQVAIIQQFVKKMDIFAAYTMYALHVHTFKKAYTEKELLQLIEQATALDVYFCNGLVSATTQVRLCYDAYQGVLSLMPEDIHESCYNVPTDFEDVALTDQFHTEVYQLWQFLLTL